MTTSTHHDRQELALTVAREIKQAVRAYTGPHWETAEGKEKAVDFPVSVSSLRGQRPDELRYGDTEFHTSVYLAESHRYRDSAGYTRSARILHDLHFELEIKDGSYTGQVTVHERSFDYDL